MANEVTLDLSCISTEPFLFVTETSVKWAIDNFGWLGLPPSSDIDASEGGLEITLPRLVILELYDAYRASELPTFWRSQL